jgi:hypothetical protein
MQSIIAIGIDSWIIQDGNYGDFAVGDGATFALEFAGGALIPSTKRTAELVHIKDSTYRICAQVVYSRPNVWVIDFGVKAYWEHEPPAFATVGAWVEGEIFLGIDPFFYQEYLHKEENIPDLSYDWAITKIERNETPWLEVVNENGGTILTRDESREQWCDTDKTDAWDDDDGRASYILHVARHDV